MKVKTATLATLSDRERRLAYTAAILPVDVHPKLILVLLLLVCCPRC